MTATASSTKSCTILGVREQHSPHLFPARCLSSNDLSASGIEYTIPCGIEIVHEKLKRDFPAERDGLDRYFRRFTTVIEATPTLNVSGFDTFPPPIEEDRITLQSVLDECASDRVLQTVLGGLCMCYGTKPDEVSFSTHCRVSYGLH